MEWSTGRWLNRQELLIYPGFPSVLDSRPFPQGTSRSQWGFAEKFGNASRRQPGHVITSSGSPVVIREASRASHLKSLKDGLGFPPIT
jgi:hypothetical protein